MNKFMSIPVENFSLNILEEDDRIAKLSMKFMHDGINLNNSEISLNSIRNAISNSLENTPTGIPILASFEFDGSDFREHNDDEIILGSVPAKNNNLYFDMDEDNGKTYAYIDGYIWRYYSRNAVDIIEESKDKSKDCSIEIEILDGFMDKNRGVYVIKSFKFLGITLLGDKYSPGMEGANIKLDFTQKCINSFKELSDALEKCFIEKNEEISTENSSEDINNNKKEDVSPMFNKESFATKFGLTAMQMAEEMSKECREEKYIDSYWECECSRYGMRDYDEQYVYCSDYKEEKIVGIPYEMSGDNVSLHFDQAVRVKCAYTPWEGGDEEVEEIPDEYVKKEKEQIKKEFDLNKTIEDKVAQFNGKEVELSNKETELNNKIVEFNSKIEEKDNTILALNDKYSLLEQTISEKDTTIETLKNEISVFNTQERKEKVENIFSKFAKHLSKEEIESFREKEPKFEKFEEFEKEIKSFVCDKIAEVVIDKEKQTFTKMALPNEGKEEEDETKPTSVWDRLTNK